MVAGMVARVSDSQAWARWSRQVERTGHCSHPVRVRGGAAAVDCGTGEVLAEYDSTNEPDGALLLPCKDRRAAVCASCAETYRRDTWHVIAAGLRGRALAGERPGVRGGVAVAVPESVSSHPVVLATFTAPSFGAVHRASGDESCREGKGRPVCEHGARLWCNARHGPDDPQVGQPVCFACYDHVGHVLWHAAVPELWRRTSVYAYRALARLAGERAGRRVTVRSVRSVLRLSYVKVAEFQKRAAVHLHVIVRLDGVDEDDPERVVPPPVWADAALLEAALREAAGRISVALPEVGRSRNARWGRQLDVSPVNHPARVAAYLAKYATKTAGDVLAGLPPRRFAVGEVSRLTKRGASPHVLCLVATCFKLAKRPDCAGLRLIEHAHTLGYRGHFATKSRRYSVTLTALRAARQAWRETQSDSGGPHGDPWAAARQAQGEGGGPVLVKQWRFLGSGFTRFGDAMLAATLAREHALMLEMAREQAAEDRWYLEQSGEQK